jgi:hypothetical protein
MMELCCRRVLLKKSRRGRTNTHDLGRGVEFFVRKT